MGKKLIETMHSMMEANEIIKRFDDIRQTHSFPAALNVFKVRQMLDAVLPIFEHEITILEDASTSGTVRVSVGRLAVSTARLNNRIQEALKEFSCL